MKNAIKYGLSIGVVSAIWLLVMHFSGVYALGNPHGSPNAWMEYVSTLIPLVGLYLGIKNFRDHENAGKMEFFEGMFEGFKIMLVAGVLVAFVAIVYVQQVTTTFKTDLMGRIFGAGILGLLCDIMISLVLMNKQRNL
jgi:hypothetical protein